MSNRADDEKDKVTTDAVAKGDKKNKGMVWNKTLRKFNRTVVSSGTKEAISNAGAIEVDTENGKVERIDVIDKDATVPFHKTAEPKSGENNTAPAKVSEIKIVKNKEKDKEKDKDKDKDKDIVAAIQLSIKEVDEKAEEFAAKAMETTEIDVKTDPEAIEAAEDAAKKIKKFSNEAETAADLEISDVKSLISLPLHSLCNRLGKIFFKRGFIAGYKFKNEKTGETEEGKGKKAQHVIYVLKLINKILSIAGSNKLTAWEIGNATDEVFCNHGILKTGDFDDVFKKGDTIGNDTLGLVRVSIGSKQKR